MANLNVDIVSAQKVLWQGRARGISAPAVEGSLGILPGHTPILAVLQQGKVQVTRDGAASLEVEIEGGFLSVDQDQVTIVVDPSTTEFTH